MQRGENARHDHVEATWYRLIHTAEQKRVRSLGHRARAQLTSQVGTHLLPEHAHPQ